MGGRGIALSIPNFSARIPWPLYTPGKVTHYQRVEGVACKLKGITRKTVKTKKSGECVC